MPLNGVPTAVSDRESSCLQRYATGRRVVEAGSLLGYSTITLARVAAHVTSIDQHVNYSGPTMRGFLSNLERHGVRERVTPIVGDCLLALPALPLADFGFIDLTGDFSVSVRALKAMRAPVIGIHDFGRSHCEGVEAAVKSLGYRVVEVVDTLCIVERTV